MRKGLAGVAATALVVVPMAFAGAGVPSKVTIGNVFNDHGDIVVFGKVKSGEDACESPRAVVVKEKGGGTLGKGKARYGQYVVETPSVSVGDKIFTVTKTKTAGGITCAKEKSKVFDVEKIVTHD